MNALNEKVSNLRRRFRELGSAVVAFSGGVDSAVLAKIAHEELGDRMIAVTAHSASVPRQDFASARVFCERHGIPHRTVESHEFDDETFRDNPHDRCYHCKKALYEALLTVARGSDMRVVVEGTNTSDLGGHRPGYRASSEQDAVVTPLIECGITKDEVRAIAHDLELGEVADKPATACLSSRIPTGTRLEPEALKRVDRAEEALRELGCAQVRVRHHGDLARIEVEEGDIATIIDCRTDIGNILQDLGYRYITLDLKGYRPATPNGAGYEVRSTENKR